ncbi:MAG: SprB repeat-containing protein [Lewinellaceae bacterium]|nr:SprB repeat-containing protein [Lewinellaceae bacterium]
MIKRYLLFVTVLACIGFATNAEGQCEGDLIVTIAGSGTGSPLTFGSATVTTAITCFGGTATVTLVVTGGTEPYSYTFNGQTNETGIFTGVSAGTNLPYSITDASTCGPITGNITVTQPDILSATVTPTQPTCNGTDDGIIAITGASGGSGSYEYSIDGGANWDATTSNTGLAPGTYDVQIRDANHPGCVIDLDGVGNTALTYPAALAATVTLTQPTCNGTDDGVIDISASGGSGSFEYSIDGGSTWTATTNNTGLAPGNYGVQVRDANHTACVLDKGTSALAYPVVLSATVTPTQPTCNGTNNGIIAITGAAGGSGSYEYSIDGGSSWDAMTSNTGLAPNTYDVQIRDANHPGCIIDLDGVGNTVLTEPDELLATATSTPVSCNGGNNGTATVTHTGGNSTFSYDWAGTPTGDGTATITGLTAGDYTVTVTDDKGCETTTSVAVSEPAAALMVSITPFEPYCNGENTGQAVATPTGGTPGYTYLWNNGNTTDNPTGLVAGTYTVVVTDSKLCTASATTVVTEPDLVVASGTQVNVLCNGAATGSIDLEVTGGSGTYFYNWSNGASTQDISGLAAGEYTVDITEVNGCTVTGTTTFTITQISAIMVDASVTSNHNGAQVSCATGQGTDDDGEITVSATGGTPGYMYSVDNGGTYQGTGDFSGLTAGTYTVVVKDANNCTSSSTVTINAPTPITAGTCTNAEDKCQLSAGQVRVDASGGTGALMASWTSTCTPMSGGPMAIPATFSGLTGNCVYNFTVEDANNCKVP